MACLLYNPTFYIKKRVYVKNHQKYKAKKGPMGTYRKQEESDERMLLKMGCKSLLLMIEYDLRLSAIAYAKEVKQQ